MTVKIMKNPAALITAMVVVVSAGAAVYLSSASSSSASVPVTSVDLSDPQAAQEALAFDPFDFDCDAALGDSEPDGAAQVDGGVGTLPHTVVAAAGETPLSESDEVVEVAEVAPEDVPEAAATEGEPKADADSKKTKGGAETGTVKGPKTPGKMKFGLTPALAGAIGMASVGGTAVGVAVSDDSSSIVRSPSTP